MKIANELHCANSFQHCNQNKTFVRARTHLFVVYQLMIQVVPLIFVLFEIKYRHATCATGNCNLTEVTVNGFKMIAYNRLATDCKLVSFQSTRLQTPITSMWVVLRKLPQLSDTHFSQVLVGKNFFLWFYKISSPSPFHLNYTSFPLP